MATIEQILRMSYAERKAEYKAQNIEKVTIDGIDFTDYGAFSFLWEKSYVKSPERSGDGSIGNLNSYATFLTPHLKIDFALMSIDSYRTLMNLIYEKNEFTVTCYDVVNNQMTTNRMYFSTEEMPKLWTIARAINGEEWVELLGVQEYSVEMIGTNTSIDTVNILYCDENGTILHSQEAVRGEMVVIQYDYTPQKGRFDGVWEKNGNPNMAIRNGIAIFANTYSDSINEIKLFAKVEPTDEYTLALVYGNGKKLYSKETGEFANSIKIRNGQKMNEAFLEAKLVFEDGTPTSFPYSGTGSLTVNVNDGVYSPYFFDGWYWTSEKPAEDSPIDADVYGNTVFNKGQNASIYQIYSPSSYVVTFVSNKADVSIDPFSVVYGGYVPYPRPHVKGYDFSGWYLDNETFEKPFNGTMPPYDITLYAKWVKIE